MKKLLIFLAWLLAAAPLCAQIIPPNQNIGAASVGGACSTGTCATWTLPNSNPSVTAQITGTMTSMTVTFEGTADGQTWFSVGATNLSSGSTATTATATGQYAIVNPGLVGFRVRCTTYSSGAVNVTLTRGTASAKSGVGGGGGSPAVTNHAVAVGTGSSSSFSAVGPGAVNTVLHGAGASADPTFAAVVEGDLSLTDITTANATSSAHGFMPKLSGNAFDFTLGDGTYSRTVARGSIATSSPWTFSQTWNAVGVAFNAFTIPITRTASATLSTPFSISIVASGDAFAVYQDNTGPGGINSGDKFSVGMNTSLSSAWAIRGGSAVAGFTTGPNNAGTRQLVARDFISGTNFDTYVTTSLWEGGADAGTKMTSGLQFGWVASATDVLTGSFDTAIARTSAAVIEANNGTPGTLGSWKGGYLVTTVKDSTTAPTIASGGCTSPAVTHSNGTAAFLLTIGSSCSGVKSLTLTMPAASHFWACDANNNTSDAQQASNTIASRATSTTAVVLTNYARTTGLTADFTAADTLLVKCSGE